MTAQERPTFRVGDVVEVTIRRAVVTAAPAAGWMQVRVGDIVHALPYPAGDQPVAVNRLAPAEWPPEAGDLWRDRDGGLWFGVVKAARYGDNGGIVQSARLVMSPARETRQIYREQSSSPEDLLAFYGPLGLVHREPRPDDSDGDE
ncbi:hypothetical protein O7622_01070 [Micromonospora sp. WMMD1076]|uniref:hypothetical protein n=1 Tax=Micromonospora sp. WMMD1076 TaxID=3016103 RepID=UPI00249AEA17|nr:hypothetical protein [Micromonospora sp. WMMD1076]WFF07221.1 hypothetical protein O7622_01070 [Micromonospora sp. WMMD1076]